MVYIQHIKFETAKLANKLGFSLRILGSHVYNYYKNDGSEGVISWGHLELDSPAKAPICLLQKWIREKYELHCDAYCNASGWFWIL